MYIFHIKNMNGISENEIQLHKDMELIGHEFFFIISKLINTNILSI